MKHSVILGTSINFIIHSVLVLSLYLVFAGPNNPGGGFIGGLAAGAAVGLRYVAGGIDEVRAATPVRPWTILGVGLVLAAGTALAPVVIGEPVLEGGEAHWDVPVLGDVPLFSSTLFDVGVYVIVIGLVLMVFEAFGDDPDGGEAGEDPEVRDVGEVGEVGHQDGATS